MEPQHHHSQQSTKYTQPLMKQNLIHATTETETVEKQSISITQIVSNNNKFQQGCEKNQRNVASNEIDPEPGTTMKTTLEHDPDIIEISYHPYIDLGDQKRTHKPIEYIDISSPFPAENDPNKIDQAEKRNIIQTKDKEIKNDGIKPTNPYLLKWVKEKIPNNNYPNRKTKQNYQQANCQQAQNYCCATTQHNNNLTSNSKCKLPILLAKQQTTKDTLSKSILPSQIPPNNLDTIPINNSYTNKAKVITPSIYLAEQNILNLKRSRNHDKVTFLYKDERLPKEEKKDQPIDQAIKRLANTKYKGMSKRFYTPNAPMYSSLFYPTAPLPLGLKHPTTHITTTGRQENQITKAINEMNQEAIRAEINMNLKTSFPGNIPNQKCEDIMDEQINNIHILNDQQLQYQGAIIIPFAKMEENGSSPLYAGAFEVQKPDQPKMWICKPCDAIVFRKSNFRAHHKSEKHAENLKIWSEKLPHVPKSITVREQNREKNSYKPSLMDLEQAMISIESIIPAKYHTETAIMVSTFFNKYLVNEDEVDLIQSFKDAQELTIVDKDKRHWINKKFEFLKRKKDPRNYMKNKWETRTVMIRRTTAQKREVKPIADLARILFATLIDCKFIHINYITFLAVIMNTRRLLNYPRSAIHLSNGFYIDLFLNPKSIINYQYERSPTNQYINSMGNKDIKRLFIKEDSEERMLEEFNPQQDEDFQDPLEQEPISPDLQEQINNDRYSPISQYNSEWTLEEIIPDLIPPNSASPDSKPNLKIHYQTQEVNKNTTKTIYISNLRQGITREEIYNLFSTCGYIEDIIKENFKSTEAIIIFDQYNAADKAVSTLNNTTFYGIIIKVRKAHKRKSLDENKTLDNKLTYEEKVPETKTWGEEFHQEYPSSSTPSPYSLPQNLNKTKDQLGQVPPNINTNMFETNIFNNESLQIVSTQDMALLPYSTTLLEAKIIKHNNKNFNISEGKVTLTCGPTPFIQINDGIYQVKESIITPTIRNDSPIVINIYKNRIIQGTSCHLEKDIIETMKNNHEEGAALHLQSKTFHFKNHLNQTSYKWNGENCLTEETNPWIMDIDNQEI